MSSAGLLVLIPSILICPHFQVTYYLHCDYAVCSASEFYIKKNFVLFSIYVSGYP